jgi:hypothetical protein
LAPVVFRAVPLHTRCSLQHFTSSLRQSQGYNYSSGFYLK